MATIAKIAVGDVESDSLQGERLFRDYEEKYWRYSREGKVQIII